MFERIDDRRAAPECAPPAAAGAMIRDDARTTLAVALRFAGAGLDCYRLSELRRRALHASSEGGR